MRKSKVELIFDKWKAELADKDRTRASVSSNFDELFSGWYRSKVPFDDAYNLLDRAIRAHQPTDSVARNTYRRLRRVTKMDKSEEEFLKEWNNNIASAGKQVFYSLYDIDGSDPKQDTKYGNMSAQEYRKQRKYAESHPLLDWTKIEIKPIEEEDVNFDDIDIDVDLGDL